MYIMDLLKERMPELENRSVILARHVLGPERAQIKAWIGDNRERFDIWQCRQETNNQMFYNCHYVVSFMGKPEGTQGEFIGVYRNISGSNPRPYMDVVNCGGIVADLHNHTPPDRQGGSYYFYELCKVETPDFSDLEGSVIIEWANPGKHPSPQAWCQHAHTNPKKIIEPDDIARR